MEDASRPHFFDGVSTVVAKLFKFKQGTFFEIEIATERQAPKVELGKKEGE